MADKINVKSNLPRICSKQNHTQSAPCYKKRKEEV